MLHLAAASLLSQRRSHGTVAEHRAALRRAASADWQPADLGTQRFGLGVLGSYGETWQNWVWDLKEFGGPLHHN